jgi:DNA-binding MarR family transcriptional regulator
VTGAKPFRGRIDPAVLATYKQLLDVARLFERVSDRNLRVSGGITFIQYEILIQLRDTGRLRMSDLAESLVQPPSTLTYQIRQLVSRNLVERLPAPGDDRSVLVGLTGDGLALLDALASPQGDLIRRYLVDPINETEIVALDHVLSKLNTTLRCASLEPGDLTDPA